MIFVGFKLRQSKTDSTLREFSREFTIKLNDTIQLLPNSKAQLTLVAVDINHKKCQIILKSSDESLINVWVWENEFFPETKLFGAHGLYLLHVGENSIVIQNRYAGH